MNSPTPTLFGMGDTISPIESLLFTGIMGLMFFLVGWIPYLVYRLVKLKWGDKLWLTQTLKWIARLWVGLVILAFVVGVVLRIF